jgi:citrate lyase subunit beta/citryl-CoA lyase
MAADRIGIAALHSFLFVPGDRPERFRKALNSGAHAVILDLEDAVTPEHKEAARLAVAGFLEQDTRCVVRVNGVESEWFEDDLAMLRAARPGAVMLPKAESAAAVATLASVLGHAVPVIALIESARGLAGCRELLATGQVARLAFGSVDFMLDLGITADGDGLVSARSELVLASRLAGRPGPIDGVTLALHDEAGLVADVDRARRFGFAGKLCVHPAQVAAVNAGFQPDAAEVAWARHVLAMAATNVAGALRVDGKLVDRPLLERARQLVAASESQATRQPGSPDAMARRPDVTM